MMTENEERLDGLTDSEESSSEAGTVESSDDGADEATPAAAGAQHNYNLRSKRVVPGTTEEPALAKQNDIAPGVGVVADHNSVGGRDASKPTDKRGANSVSVKLAGKRVEADSNPAETEVRTLRDPHPQVVDRSGGVAWSIPVPRARGRPRRPDEEVERRSSATGRRDAEAGGGATARARPKINVNCKIT